MTADALSLVDVRFADKGAVVLGGVTLEVPQGGAVGIVGSDGSGKTCLLRLACGLLAPTGGRVDLLGTRLPATPRVLRAVQSRVGYFPQDGGLLSNLTLRDNVLLPLRYHGRLDDGARDSVRRLTDRMDLAPHLDRIPADVPIGARRRAALVRALAPRPALLLADHLAVGDGEGWTAIVDEAVGQAREVWGMALVATARTVAQARAFSKDVQILRGGILLPWEEAL
ncbi:MAG: ATP-binding cassette domain-containing protein [Planctomycetes bacterium]|nr:ATP-binding cassette domain-containing protein [Planctomycetota bacterium]